MVLRTSSRDDGRNRRLTPPAGRSVASSASRCGTSRRAAIAPTPAHASRCASGSTPTAAKAPAAAAPVSAPKENAACSEENSGRSARRSTARPLVFIAMSRAPLAAPTTKTAATSVGRSTATAGSATASMDNGAAATTGRDPRLATSNPVAGCASSRPTGAPSSAMPT